MTIQFSSVSTRVTAQSLSHSVMWYSLQPHEMQHDGPSCPSPTPGDYPNSHLLSRWCPTTISSSVSPFSPCPQPFPASGTFLMSKLYISGGQSIGIWASTSILPMNTQDSTPLGWTGWISVQSKGHTRVFFNAAVQKYQSFMLSILYASTIRCIYDYWKNRSLD